jgi:hypothetical protein
VLQNSKLTKPNFCILHLYKLANNTYICIATEPIEYRTDKTDRVYGDYACKGAGITNAAEYLLAEVEGNQAKTGASFKTNV